MSAPISTRLLLRPRTIYNVYVAACIAAFFVLTARGLRNVIAPLAGERDFVAFVSGACTFTIASVLGSLLAFSVFELEVCAFSAGLPGLRRRIRLEVVCIGAIVVLAAGITGATLLAQFTDGFVLAILAALGFGLGIVASDPENRLLRSHGFLTLLGFLGLAVLVPEIEGLVQRAPLLAAVVATAIAAALLAYPFRAERAHRRALTSATMIDAAYREFDVQSGQWLAAKGAHREGRARFESTRRTDSEWAGVWLHERNGTVRGGWILAGVARAGISCLCLLGYQWIATTGGPADSTVFERFSRSVDKFGDFVGPAFFLGLWTSIVALGLPALAVTGPHRPISRARRARISWISSAAEDLLHVVALVVLLSLLVLVVARYATPGTMPSFRGWIMAALVVAICTPAARWMRLRFLDPAHGNPGPVRQGVVAAVSIVLVCAGSSLLLGASRAASNIPFEWQLCASAALIGGTQLAWRAALRRHHERRDLAV